MERLYDEISADLGSEMYEGNMRVEAEGEGNKKDRCMEQNEITRNEGHRKEREKELGEGRHRDRNKK